MAGISYVTEEVVFNTTALGGVGTFALNVSDREFRPLADGSPDPGFIGTVESEVRAMLATHDIKNGYTYCGFGGYALTGNGLVVYARPLATAGIRGATDSQRITIATGLVVPRRLTAAQGVAAMLEMEVIGFKSDGTTPIAIATNSTALTSPTQNIAYTLGPCYLNGSQLSDVDSLEIDFGVAELPLRSDGLIYMKNAGIIGRMPVIRLGTRDAALMATVAAGGLAVTQFDAYLRRLTLGGGGTAAGASSVHTKIAVNVGMAKSLAAGGRPHRNGIEIHPYKDSSEQVVITFDEALP